MKNNKLLFSLIFVLGSLLSCAQDMILKRDSSVIFCHIIKEDSATIYYRQKQGEQTMELNVKKADVLGYYSKKAQILAERRRADSIEQVSAKKDTVWAKNNTLNSKSDSVQTKVVSIPPKRDSVLVKKDSLQQKTIAIKPASDTIVLNSNYKCFYKGELITRGEVLALMKGNMEAYQEMKKAREYFAPVIPLGIGTLVLAGVFIYDAVSDGNFHWIVGGSSIIAAAIAVTLKQTCNLHIGKSVKFYNAKPSVAGIGIPKFELGAASKGVGLCLKF